MMSNSKGFTLIELLVVSVLLVILSSLLYSTINGIIQARSLVEAEIETTSKAHYLIERIGRELTSVSSSFPLQSDDPKKAPSSGFNNSIFLGTDLKGQGGSKDSISFVTNVGGQIIPGQNNNYGSAQITYKLVKTAKKFGDKKTYKLIREEFPAGAQDQKTIKLRKLTFPISENVVSINFRYYLQKKWLNAWDQNQTGYPEAVEMTIQLEDSEGKIRHFRTAYALRRQNT